MPRLVVGIAAALLFSFAGPAFAEDMTEEIQEEEQPGSEIELERKSGAPDVPAPEGGTQLELPNDPDTPAAHDPVDAELPGEGPEDLSGPDDDDPLPE
jgi:hypothetical protein